jgi:hypothetical protein
MARFTYIANGDIRRARFVKPTNVAYRCLEADAGEVCIGIGDEYAQDAPLTGASDLAASADRPIGVFFDGDECYLTAGGSFSAGAELKSDADGKGVAASSTNSFYAVALQASTGDGQLVKVRVMRGVKV